MNWIDLLLIIIILMSVWAGWRKGFILSIIELASLLGSVVVAFLFYENVAAWLQGYFGAWTLPLAFIGTMIATSILISIILHIILRDASREVHHHGINKFLGLFPGLAKGLINAVIVAALLLSVPLWEGLTVKARESNIANRLAIPVEWLDELLSPVFDEAVEQSINKLTIHPESDKTVPLHFTVSNPKIREDLEAKMLEMVNEERVQQGLPPVKADPEMATVARAHSRDMLARGYFSHYSPEGKTLNDRLRAKSVRFLTAGENLAIAPTLKMAHSGLMNSPGHRANILNPAYGRLGIGILDAGIHGIMVTQNFRN